MLLSVQGIVIVCFIFVCCVILSRVLQFSSENRNSRVRNLTPTLPLSGRGLLHFLTSMRAVLEKTPLFQALFSDLSFSLTAFTYFINSVLLTLHLNVFIKLTRENNNKKETCANHIRKHCKIENALPCSYSYAKKK